MAALNRPLQFSEGDSWATQQRALLAGDKLRAVQEKEIKRRAYVKNLQDDIMSMQQTGKASGKVQQSDVIDLYGKEAADHHQEAMNHAAKFYAITSNFTRMPDDMIESSLNDLADHGKNDPAFLAAVEYAGKVRRLRDTDPAQAVDDLPEVKAAAGSNDKRALIQARLDAQRTLGIMQAPLTMREQQAMLAPLMQAAFQDRASPPKPNTSSQTVLAIKGLREGLDAQYGPELAERILSSSLYASQRSMSREGVFGNVMKEFSPEKESAERPLREPRQPKLKPLQELPVDPVGTDKAPDTGQRSGGFEPHPMLGDLVPKATGNLMDNPYLGSQIVDQLETDKVANMLGLKKPDEDA